MGWYALFSALLLLGLAGSNWLVDPLQFFRRAAYPPVYSENQRYQNPGLARNYDYETVIIGTSHAENFLPSHALRLLGENSLKLAISGSSAHEQALILGLALKTGRVEHVVWAMDHIAFKKPPRALGNAASDFPLHLYRLGLDTFGLYLLSLDSLALSLEALLGRGHRDLESLNTWHDQWEFSRARVMADWQRRASILDRIKLDSTLSYTSTAERSSRSVRFNLVRLARAHPGVRFDVFFPPYSILAYLADDRAWERAFEERQAYKAFVVEVTADLPNVRVFDFQAIARINHDLDNYKDLEHFSLEISDYILDSLAKGRHRVTRESHPEVLARQADQLDRYIREVCRAGSRTPFLCPRRTLR